jgi:hypothetical protein
MPKLPPDAYLTIEEQRELRKLTVEIGVLRNRHAELMKKIRQGLPDSEKMELREVIERHNQLEEEQRSLLAKNPLLPENIIKGSRDE